MKNYTLLFLSICFFFGAILHNEAMLKIGFWGFVIYQTTIWYRKETETVFKRIENVNTN
jgi:hypothetical protein